MHTPGPWRIERNGRDATLFGGPNSNYVATVTIVQLGPPALCSWMEPEREANALLISAAPDLAAELSQLALDLQSFLDSGTAPDAQWLSDNIASINKHLDKAGIQ